MTYGGGGEGGSQQREGGGNDFAYALARMAVAQICESVEISTLQGSHAREGARFSSFQESALERLTGVVIQYIQSVGKTTKFYGNMAGRAEGNALDVVQALEDLGSGLGFSCGHDVERCRFVVKDVVRYTGEAEEMPFVYYSLPRYPFNRGKRRAPPSFSENGGEMPDEHVPVWLPAFPETKMSKEVEERTNRLSLQKSMQKSLDVDRLKVQKDVQEPAEGNPFLAAPVWVREKDVPPRVFSPSEPTNEEVSIDHHIPPLEEAHASPGVINDESRVGGTEDEEKTDGARTQRELLRFKIGTRRKTLMCWTIKQRLEDKGWLLEEGEECRTRNH